MCVVISPRPLYRRSEGGVSSGGVAYEVDTLTVDLFHPEPYSWVFGAGLEMDVHDSEAQVSVTVLCWRLVVWWHRPDA